MNLHSVAEGSFQGSQCPGKPWKFLEPGKPSETLEFNENLKESPKKPWGLFWMLFLIFCLCLFWPSYVLIIIQYVKTNKFHLCYLYNWLTLFWQYFFYIKLSNLHYTNKQSADNIEIYIKKLLHMHWTLWTISKVIRLLK